MLLPGELLDDVFAHAPVGLALFDADLRYLRVNPALAALNGRPAGEHIGRTLREVVDAAAADALEPGLRATLAGERAPPLDVNALRAVFVPVRPGGGDEVQAVAVLVFETPDRREIERALEVTRSRLELAMEGTETGTFEWEVATNEVRWSENLGPLWGRPRGWSPQTYEQYLEGLHPDDRAAMESAVREALEEGRDYEREHRIVRPDGTVRWLVSRVHVLRNERGATVALTGLVSDITDRMRDRLAAELLAQVSGALAESLDVRATLQRLADMAVPALADCCTVALTGEDGGHEIVAIAHDDPGEISLFRELQDRGRAGAQEPLGLPGVLATARARLWAELDDELLMERAEDAEHLALLRSLRIRSAIVVPLVARGQTHGALTLIHAGSGRRYDAGDLELAEEIGRRVGLALDSALTHRAQSEANRRLRSLQAVTDAALGHLELDELLDELLRRVREATGTDFAAVQLLDRERAELWVRAAVGMPEEVWRPVRLRVGEGLAGRVLETGEPLIVNDLLASADFPTPAGYLQGRVRSVVSVPLRAAGEIIAVLQVGTTRLPRTFTENDVDLLELVADRAARAIHHARLYEQARDTAATLQRSLLPQRLPAIPGYEVDALYRPGQDGAEVGGDWYDVFPLPGGIFAVAVGDVVGRGIRAAAMMGQLRAATRAYAREHSDPAVALQHLDALVDDLIDVPFATVALLVLDPSDGVIRACSAGHPPPVLRRRSEATLATIATGVPLGAPAASRTSSTLRLEVGDALVLYTDGLAERRTDSLDERLELLCSVVADAPEEPAALLQHVQSRMLVDQVADDAAAIALRRLA